MNKLIGGTLLSLLLLMTTLPACGSSASPLTHGDAYVARNAIDLPTPRFDSGTSIESSLKQRRSIRDYTNIAVTIEELSQLLWAAQGITNDRGYRTAPSAGGLYPLELYVVAGNVSGLEPGIYHFRPVSHDITLITAGDWRDQLADISLGQQWVKDAALTIVMAAVYERTTERYGERGIKYVHMEIGHAAQNVYLQAVALELGTVTVGAFRDNDVGKLLKLSSDETPLYVMPVGKLNGSS